MPSLLQPLHAAQPLASSHASPTSSARSRPLALDMRMASPDDDHSNDTASEPAEPTTPSSHPGDAIRFTNPFGDDDPSESLSLKTRSAAKAYAPQARPALATTASSYRSQPKLEVNTRAEELGPSPERSRLGKRVGSFVRSKLHRTPVSKDGLDQLASRIEAINGLHLPDESLPPSRNGGTDGFLSTPGDDDSGDALHTKNFDGFRRRLSSFARSARNSPKPSRANSPPSPSSPSSTISNDQNVGKKPPKTSMSSTALSNMPSKRPGITWAGSIGRGGRHAFGRRRSVSAEQVALPTTERKATAGMIPTFSKHANEGVGMKARRLSLNLPDEFAVDSCELDTEFKRSSLMPTRKGKILGRGATAEVCIMARRGFHHEDLVAVKIFRQRDEDESEEDYSKKIKSEYSIAKSLHHPNIVETVRLCTHRGRWNHVMEFCAHGELYSLVERKLFSPGETGHYTQEDRLCFFKQLLRGVDYLHGHGIAHRDIKLENLLLDRHGHLKISDFGVAEVFSGVHPGLRSAGGECGKGMGSVRLSAPGICGSLPYIAPEVLAKEGSYDPRPLDIWSCAIAFLTMTFAGCPWQAAKLEFEFYARFYNGYEAWLQRHPDGEMFNGPDGHPKCGKLFSLIEPPPVKRLVLKMLRPDPAKRLTIREVVDSTTVRNINCCTTESYENPKCCVDASKGAAAAGKSFAVQKKYLHHHVPPKAEGRFGKAFTHRFDMGDGY